MRKKSPKLRKVDVIYRRSEGRIRAYYYEPTGNVIDRIYDYVKRVWEKYRIVTSIKTQRFNGKKFVVLKQDREDSISIYVCVDDGFVYVPKSYFRKYDPFFVYACCQYVVYGLGYRVRSKVVREVEVSNRKIYKSKGSK